MISNKQTNKHNAKLRTPLAAAANSMNGMETEGGRGKYIPWTCSDPNTAPAPDPDPVCEAAPSARPNS